MALKDSPSSLESDLLQLKEHVYGSKVHYALCDGGASANFSGETLRMVERLCIFCLSNRFYFKYYIFTLASTNWTLLWIRDLRLYKDKHG